MITLKKFNKKIKNTYFCWDLTTTSFPSQNINFKLTNNKLVNIKGINNKY